MKKPKPKPKPPLDLRKVIGFDAVTGEPITYERVPFPKREKDDKPRKR